MANHWPKPMFRELDRCPPKAKATRSGRRLPPPSASRPPKLAGKRPQLKRVKSMIRLCGEGEDMKWMKSMARQNLMVSAINTTLERDLITLGMRAFRAGGVRI
jgi:hypothetical protein